MESQTVLTVPGMRIDNAGEQGVDGLTVQVGLPRLKAALVTRRRHPPHTTGRQSHSGGAAATSSIHTGRVLLRDDFIHA